LLGRFVLPHEQAAFAVLGRGCGSMELDVCRRRLRHEQDAEDVFAIAFPVFVRLRAVAHSDEEGDGRMTAPRRVRHPPPPTAARTAGASLSRRLDVWDVRGCGVLR
jgi:hypothetical protein